MHPPDSRPPTTDHVPPSRSATLHSSMWAVGGALGRYLLAGVTTLALTHLLAPADFGLVTITALVQLLIENTLPVGFQDALVQRPQLTPSLLDSAFWSVLSVTGAAVMLVVAIAFPVADWFSEPQLAPLLVGSALAALLRAVSTVPRALLHRRMDFRTLALARVLGLLIAGVSAIGLAVLGAGAWSLIAHIALVNAVTSVLIARRAQYRPGMALSRTALRGLWRFAPIVTLFFALTVVIKRFDDQIVGLQLGPGALGHYALAYAFMAWPVYDVLGGAAVVLYPVFSRLQNDRTRLQRVYLESLTLATLFAFPALVLLAITAPVLIPWLLGAQWAPAAVTAQVFALGGTRTATGMLNGGIYRALNRPHLHMLLELVSAPCYVVAFLVGVQHGIAGVALLTVLTGILLQPLSWLLLFRVTGLSLRRWIAAVLPAGGGALLLALAAVPTLHLTTTHTTISTDLRLLITGVISSAVYGLWLIMIRPTALRRVIGDLKRLC